ncbi:MAG: thymidine kinase [Thermococcaceae archaeon]|nr:thymidine kinase [Thermococcaceae archaeon]
MHPEGFLEVITGPMFAGKTSELIKRIERQMFAKRTAALFKPSIDNRYSEDKVVAHNGLSYEAFVVPTTEEGVEMIYQKTKEEGFEVIGVDEAFEVTKELLAMADNIVYLTAICSVCGREATRTQRLINGKPAPRNSPRILVGGMEAYEARCRKHHIVL